MTQEEGIGLEAVPEENRARRHALLALKGVITLALVVLLVRNIDLKAMSARIMQADAALLAVAFLFLAFQLALSGLRWRRIAARLGIALTRVNAVRLVWIGHFFSQALPTAIGGDVVRAWLAARETGMLGRAISSVLCDRAIALVVLLVMASASQLLLLDSDRPALEKLRLALWLLTAAALGTLLLGAEVVRPLARFRAGEILRRVLADVRSVMSKPWRLMGAISAYSVLVQLCLVTAAWFIGRSLGLPLDYVSSLVMVPPILVASMIPVSIGGWGVREGAMVVGLGLVGVPAEGALALSILFGLGHLAVGLPGGILWLAGKRVNRPTQL